MRNTPRRYVLVLADDHINHIWFGEGMAPLGEVPVIRILPDTTGE